MIKTQRWEKCSACRFERPVSTRRESHRATATGHIVTAYWVDIPEEET